MSLQPSDKVTINSPAVLRLYGIKPDTEFEIKSVGDNKVTLTNGWELMKNFVDAVVKQPEFDLEDAVDEQLAHFIDEDISFTAWDATVALRSQYPNEVIPHYQVKEIVHEIMEEIDSYKRQLIEVGQPVQPWLYYPEEYDPSTYKVGRGAQVLGMLSKDKPVGFVFTGSQSANAYDITDSTQKVVKQPSLVRRFLSKFRI